MLTRYRVNDRRRMDSAIPSWPLARMHVIVIVRPLARRLKIDAQRMVAEIQSMDNQDVSSNSDSIEPIRISASHAAPLLRKQLLLQYDSIRDGDPSLMDQLDAYASGCMLASTVFATKSMICKLTSVIPCTGNIFPWLSLSAQAS